MQALYRRVLLFAGIAIASVVGLYFFALPALTPHVSLPPLANVAGDAVRGEYIAAAGGCYACHTEKKSDAAFAGGRALKTPFGTLFTPNITPDRKTGIGSWSMEDFARAMLAGLDPNGRHYFPAFPYTSYTNMTAQDLADLKAYLDTLPAISKPAKANELAWPFSDRNLIAGWKLLYFSPGLDKTTGATDAAAPLARGRYIVEVLGHCGECHTQRNLLGGRVGPALAGNTRGPGGAKVPTLRSLAKQWSNEDLEIYLADGMTPDGDFAGGEMVDVIDHSTSKLTENDRKAIATYLLDVDGGK